MSRCTWCLGCGEVRIPVPKVATAFGLVTYEPKAAVRCLLCGGSGEMHDV